MHHRTCLWPHSEADRIEEQENSQGVDALALTGEGNADMAAAMLSHVDEQRTAVVIINAQGQVKMVNKPLLKMFGYKKSEVQGKNVSMLMPQPFSGRHPQYLRNYVTTGKRKILDVTQEV
jgi:PAS domain-containing protein